MLEPLLLIGAGGHAVSCIDVIEQQGRYKIMGLIGLVHEVGKEILGYPILGTDSDLPKLLQQFPFACNGVGQIKSSQTRIQVYETIQSTNAQMPIIISPRAYVSPHASIDEGTIIMHDVIVNAGVKIGRNCIINSKALLEHDVKIEDHCHISTGSIINGHCSIGQGTFIGSGSQLKQSLNIGAHCFIGIGQTVIKNCANDSWIT